jgi:hypothetical protein
VGAAATTATPEELKGAVSVEYSSYDVVGMVFVDDAGNEEDLDSEEDASQETSDAVVGPEAANATYNREDWVADTSPVVAVATTALDVTLRLAGTVITLPSLAI